MVIIIIAIQITTVHEQVIESVISEKYFEKLTKFLFKKQSGELSCSAVLIQTVGKMFRDLCLKGSILNIPQPIWRHIN